jgi:hypothetical protein
MKEKYSAKDLLNQHSSPLDAASLFNAMYLAGLLEEKKYLSSTGSGELKSYHSLTDSGLKYGLNQGSRYSEKTDVKLFSPTFKELLVVASTAVLKHSESL